MRRSVYSGSPCRSRLGNYCRHSLAAKVVEKAATAINPRGEIYTEENIGEILSMRDFMKELRDGGSITGGPSSFGPKDVQQFANSLNKLLGS